MICVQLTSGMRGKQGRSIGGDQLYWQLRDSVESTRQLQLRDELIAKGTLSAAVGAGQSEVNAQISSSKTVSGWCSQSPSLRLSGLLPEPTGNLWRS